jgi:hypothetical protein
LQKLQSQLSSAENTYTTMAPPKLGASSQTYKRPRSNIRAPQQPQESEQQPPRPPKIVNVDEISSPDMASRSPNPVVEKTQQTALVGMDIDMPELGQNQQTQDIGNPSRSKNPEEALTVNRTVPNQAEMVAPERSHTTMQE